MPLAVRFRTLFLESRSGVCSSIISVNLRVTPCPFINSVLLMPPRVTSLSATKKPWDATLKWRPLGPAASEG